MENLGFYAFQACSKKHARSLAIKARRLYGQGYQRGTWLIVGLCNNKPWAFREALPNGNWDMYFGETAEAAAEAANIKF